MKISLIAAVDQNGGIGKNGRLPWNFKQDLKFFSKTTRGKICIMGKNTYHDIFQAIGNKDRLLPKRDSIVISRDRSFTPYGAQSAVSVPDALIKASMIEDKDIVFTGGKTIYEAAHSFIDTAYITYVPGSYDCDVFFPQIETFQNFYNKEILEQYEDGLIICKYEIKSSDDK